MLEKVISNSQGRGTWVPGDHVVVLFVQSMLCSQFSLKTGVLKAVTGCMFSIQDGEEEYGVFPVEDISIFFRFHSVPMDSFTLVDYSVDALLEKLEKISTAFPYREVGMEKLNRKINQYHVN